MHQNVYLQYLSVPANLVSLCHWYSHSPGHDFEMTGFNCFENIIHTCPTWFNLIMWLCHSFVIHRSYNFMKKKSHHHVQCRESLLQQIRVNSILKRQSQQAGGKFFIRVLVYQFSSLSQAASYLCFQFTAYFLSIQAVGG